jgi:hypothetical protein
LLVAALAGATLVVMGVLGSASGTRTIFVPRGVVTATSQPGTTAAALATMTPQVAPTSTRQPTAPPGPRLTVSPLTMKSLGPVCYGDHYITNNSGQTLQWQWQSDQPSGWPSTFKWGINTGNPQNSSWPPNHDALAAGSTDDLFATMSCPRQSTTYHLTLTDSLGHTYAFAMTIPAGTDGG